MTEWQKTLALFFGGTATLIATLAKRYWNKRDTRKGKALDQNKQNKTQTLFHSLNNAIFVSEYKQGEMIDRTRISFKTSGHDQITADHKVRFQFGLEDTKTPGKREYPKSPDYFELTVSFYNNTLLLTFKNKNKAKKHIGSFILEADNNRLFGLFVVYYPPIPPERKVPPFEHLDNQTAGEIEFFRCSEKMAKKFMNFEIGIEDIKRSKTTY